MASDPSTLESDALAQAEEREALCAIYGDESVRWDPSLRVLTLAIGGGDDEGGAEGDDAASLLELELRVLLPEDYPSRSPPVVEVVVVGGKDDDYDNEPLPPAAAELAKEVDDACQQGANGDDAADAEPPFWIPGEVALFPLAERAREVRRAWLERQRQEARRRREREKEEEEEERRRRAATAAAATKDADDEAAAVARKRPPPPSEDGCDPAHVDRMAQLIVSGEPVVERKSTFQAHVAAVESVADVKAAVAALLRVPKIRNCTHNIMAYRIRRETSSTTTTWLADCDDDGEDAAGGRLLQLLHSSGAEGVVVVVSRWFGGVLLGPSRFALINNTARALLVREGYISNAGGGGGGKKGGGGNK